MTQEIVDYYSKVYKQNEEMRRLVIEIILSKEK